VASANVVNETFDDETVVVDLDSGTYFSLTELASCIWTALPGATRDELLEQVADRYPGAGDEVRRSVGAFLDALEAEGLVRVDGLEGPASTPLPATPERFVEPWFEKFDDMQDLLLLDPIHDVDETGWPTRPV
jgi:hypothetical protein